MPNFRKKSEENLSAADLLIDRKMFTSSVHCSYYAGFQFSKYVLANYCGIGYNIQDNNTNGMNSHVYIEATMAKELRRLNNKDSAEYSSVFSKLKYRRKKADYSQSIIADQEAKKAYSNAIKLITLLKTNYSIL